MSTPTFGGSVDAVLSAQQQGDQRRQQQQENSARLAVNMFTYATVGVGDHIPAQPIMFDCVFLVEPAFSGNPALVKAPDLDNFYLPSTEVGVLRWITKDLLGSASSPPSADTPPPAQAGVLVASDRKKTERPGLVPTGDPNQQVGYIGAYVYFKVEVVATDDSAAFGPPNDLVVHHHLVFQQMAMKNIDPAVQKPLSGDSKVSALTSPLTSGLAAS